MLNFYFCPNKNVSLTIRHLLLRFLFIIKKYGFILDISIGTYYADVSVLTICFNFIGYCD